MKTDYNNESGYTLVEISVALVAGSIVFGFVLLFHSGVSRLISRTEARQEIDTTVQSAMRSIESDLRNALYVDTAREAGIYKMIMITGDTVLYHSTGEKLIRNGQVIGLARLVKLDIQSIVDTVCVMKRWNIALKAVMRTDTMEIKATVTNRQRAWNRFNE